MTSITFACVIPLMHNVICSSGKLFFVKIVYIKFIVDIVVV